MKFLDTEIDGFSLRQRLGFAKSTLRNNPKLAAVLILGDITIGAVIVAIGIAVFCL